MSKPIVTVKDIVSAVRTELRVSAGFSSSEINALIPIFSAGEGEDVIAWFQKMEMKQTYGVKQIANLS